MTNREAADLIKLAKTEIEWNYPLDYQVAFDMGIKALEPDPCEDAISRQAVIDAIDKWVKNMGVLTVLPASEITPLFENIHKLPLVNPQPKTGYWIDTGSGQMCSSCGEIQYGYDSFRRFCASCRARMIESESI